VRVRLLLPLAAIAACAALPAPAAAIPWDTQGVIPPSATPAPTKPDPQCGASYANDAPRPAGRPLHFGIGPLLAGEAGAGQVTPTVPERTKKRDAALRRLRGHHPMTVRLNRLFMSDGAAGIHHYQRLARHFSRLGYHVEIQVRYHPTPAQEGNIRAWLRYVRRVVRAFGPINGVRGLQITNEVNITFSPNTSDGAYDRALEALARGVPAAKREARKRGFDRLQTGFNYSWRYGPSDVDFWQGLREIGGKRLRRATDWVGLDAYPGTFVPPGGVVNPGDELLEALAQVRECFMPMGGFGRRMPLRLEEIGYPTGPGRSEATQVQYLRAFVQTASRYRGTYGVESLNWFGLRDNNSSGPNFQSHFGLLRDDYSPKPAFAVYRRLVRRLGR
jgi:hypothetical protein